jgi:metal-dependent HD superfamily phosphatase/phosphodiesterase
MRAWRLERICLYQNQIRPIQTTIVLSDINGTFSAQELLKTPREPSEAIRHIVDSIERIKKQAGFKGTKTESA